MGIGDWGLGDGEWGVEVWGDHQEPKAQPPIPTPDPQLYNI